MTASPGRGERRRPGMQTGRFACKGRRREGGRANCLSVGLQDELLFSRGRREADLGRLSQFVQLKQKVNTQLQFMSQCKTVGWKNPV